MLRIKSISLDFPNMEDGTAICYDVGKQCYGTDKIVTKIIRGDEQGIPIHYQIYSDETLLVTMFQFGTIRYFEDGGD